MPGAEELEIPLKLIVFPIESLTIAEIRDPPV